ncbi:MAG: tripartite tricarboxylate transporter TctB family protein [Gemmatimonadetes bacterium]|nr:tripartite tricarboxylate transporter TctB family protein [Gemmatimonadota bacterium]
MTDRITGVVALLLAAAVAFEARMFRVTFLTDPIGPRALPWLAAALIAAGALVLLFRPAPDPEHPAAGATRRIALAIVACTTYAALLAPIGFFAATTLLGAALSVLFGAQPVRATVAAGAFSAALWALFAILLGLPLPAGDLFFAAR